MKQADAVRLLMRQLPREAFFVAWLRNPLPKNLQQLWRRTDAIFSNWIQTDFSKNSGDGLYHFTTIRCIDDAFSNTPCHCFTVRHNRIVRHEVHLPYQGNCRTAQMKGEK